MLLTSMMALSALLFAALYPLFSWMTYRQTLIPSFYQFNHGLCAFCVAMVLTFLALFPNLPFSAAALAIWLGAILAVTAWHWGRDYVTPVPMTVVSLAALGYLGVVLTQLWPGQWLSWFFLILGSLVVASVIFAESLGHWYLNFHGLPIHYLVRAVRGMGVLFLLRLIADSLVLFGGYEVLYLGEPLRLWAFMQTSVGFLLWVALAIGGVFSLALTVMTLSILKLKNNQAATGVLYVILAAVLMGDLFFKYYFFRYGVAL